jgi:hypothetical protein
VIKQVSEPYIQSGSFNPEFVLTANQAISARLYVASYDEKGKLLDLATNPIVLGVGEMSNIQAAVPYKAEAASYKFFIWDESFVPLTGITSL